MADLNLLGTNAADTLTGGTGNDTLDGGLGADRLVGGRGNDVYYVDNAGDVIVENNNEGTDEVRTTLSSYTLAANIEKLTYVGSGGFAGTGNSAANVLTGGVGNDTLDGGAGADTMSGGAGNDVYVVDNTGDVVTEAAGGGIDQVRTSLAVYTLGANLDNLTYTGASNFTGTGNGLDNAITGGNGSDNLNGGLGADTMSGGAGNDTYLVDNAGDAVVEAAGGGTDEVRTTLTAYALGANVESLTFTGSGAFAGVGNALANTLTGGAGNDTLDGGIGADRLTGGTGNDVYIVDNAGDVIAENNNGGTDEVRTALSSYTLGSNLEALMFTGSGAFSGTGNGSNNVIAGGAGNDSLDGKTGSDTMTGGAGNDTYVVDTATDVVVEMAGGGTDEVRTSLTSYTLGANVENLTYTGSSAFAGIGNDLDNAITGGSGNNTLDGKVGADTLAGFGGNDIYFVDNAGDVVIEAAGAGTDEVRTTLSSYTLGNNVENLTALANGDFNGLGNALVNAITGGAGNDTLDGGAGADRLAGGAGNDLYIVDSALDQVIEAAGAGIDEVRTTLASYTIGTNVENVSFAGAGAFTGVGNTADNVLVGGSGADSLFGAAGNDTLIGGGGADTLAGGAGNDVYMVDSAGDSVIEALLSGTDEVRTTLSSYTLAANVENLTYTGSGSFAGIGNALDNVVTGGAAADRIDAGAGNDTVHGGGGADVLSGGAGIDLVLGDGEGATFSYVADGTWSSGYLVNVAGDPSAPASGITFSLAGYGQSYDVFRGTDTGNTLVVGDGHNAFFLEDAISPGASTIRLSNIQTIIGGSGGQIIDLTSSSVSYGDVTITGGSGDDILLGNSGSDAITGGAGTDYVWGGSGSDTLTGGGNDSLYGGAGDDAMVLDLSGGLGATLIDGGAGTNTLQIQFSGAQWGTARGQIMSLEQALAQGGGEPFTLSSLGGVTITGITEVEVVVDGQVIEANTASSIVEAGTTDQLVVGHGASVGGMLAVTDPEGDSVTFSVDTGPAHGSVVFNGTNGQFTYLAADYVGTDSFVLKVTDSYGAVTTQTVTVDVTNAAPVVGEGTTTALSVAHNHEVSGALAITDADGDSLSYAIETGPANGTVTFTDGLGHFTYQAGDGVGADSFVVRVSDGHGGVTLQTISVDVTNAGPELIGSETTAALSVAHGQVVTGAIAASDVDGDTLTYAVLTGPSNGTVVFTGANGTYTYQAGDGVGADSFVLSVSDGHGGFTTQTVTVDVTNAAPVVDAEGTTAALTVSHNDSVSGAVAGTDGDGDVLSYSLLTGPANGSVALTETTGQFIYQAGGVVGADSFVVQVSDGHGGTFTQTVSLDLTNAGPAVVAGATTAALSVSHNNAVNGTIVAADADGDSLTYSVLSGPANGTVTWTDAAGHYTYQAGAGVGADSFVLQVTDGHGGITTQTVSVDVTNAGPVIAAGTTTTAAVMHFGTVSGTIVASDVDGDALTYSLQSGPTNGTFAFTDANGHYTYTAGDAAAIDSFTLQVSDGYGGIATQTVTIGVTGTLDLSGATAAVSVNVGARTAVNAPVELLPYTIDVKGSGFGDVVYGDARANVLSGAGGKDEVHGAGGNDTVDGGVGDDKLFGEDGNDLMYGGDGNDAMNGGGNLDTMYGGAGNDGFFGGGAADLIFGEDGNDRIVGDGGHDFIYGGTGNDTMTGGTLGGAGEQGNDTFVWQKADVVNATGAPVGFDRITDFGAGDRMDFSRMFSSHPAVVGDVVHVADTAAGTVVSAAVGAGGAFVDVVILDGVHGVTVDDLVHNNQLIT